MNELYWITRLDGVIVFFVVVAIMSAAVLIFLGIGYFNELEEMEEEELSRIKKWMRASAISLAISSVALVFIPTTKQALMIYGIGGTIDYIKSNDGAKQLPDKAVKASEKED